MGGRQLIDTAKRLLVSCGFDLRLHSAQRVLLETVIFPYLVERPEFKTILFVGCEWYTKGYNKVFSRKSYWTLEVDPGKRRYGAKQHIVDSLENIRHHFRADHFDLIICNGVYGWGLNDQATAEKAFDGCYEALREGGMFILGWNDLPKRRPFPLSEVLALKRFRRHVFPPLGEADYLVTSPTRHVFSFYVK